MWQANQEVRKWAILARSSYDNPKYFSQEQIDVASKPFKWINRLVANMIR